ncbi:zinc finger protein 282-like isoform X3 [Pleurodeles waltl]|uniref:zinc finger protein 282-like isoform X3 n=1 Tax=Pleurodeles waltl TaxID=8319 RepID=UPI0037096300
MPVTFHDAAVHFSAEEWTQLHEWQKELYRKVMKEIHQALISLGPIIAATVFSLQAKENGDLCIVDIQDSERQQCGNPSASAVISTSSPIPFWVTTEENDCLKGSQDSDRLESSGNLSPEHQAISIVLKEEEEHYPIDNQEFGRGECSVRSKGQRPSEEWIMESHRP